MPIDYSRIPAELQIRHQFCVWRYEHRDGDKPTKVPYNAITGRMASVTDSSTWCSFQDAVNAAIVPGSHYNGIGFILSEDDPYCFIDLDAPRNELDVNRQLRIYEEFNSYSERSPSGNGLHIIVKAKVPAGRKRANIEIYSDARYMTMTGDVFRDAPINEAQQTATILWDQMGAGTATGDRAIVSQPQTMDDEEVLAKAAAAANGVKFCDLHNGHWQNYYSSQSEGDFAYINIIVFYTQNIDQIIRMFRASALGLRPKAQRMNYVMDMVYRAFDMQLPPIDIIEAKERFEIARNEGKIPNLSPQEGIDHTTALAQLDDFWKPKPIEAPGGMVGEIMQYIYAQAARPVPEMALCAALGLMAGICGRGWNISSTGLNLYLLLLASTGTGKEAMATGINALISYIADETKPVYVPAAKKFIGPSDFASGQAMYRHFDNCPDQISFLSIIGEFGLKMQQIAHPRATAADASFKRALLDLYQKSGAKSVLGATAAADKDNGSKGVRSPAMSLLAESTPGTFYEVIDEDNIKSGLLSRFITIEYLGERVAFNEGHSAASPSPKLLDDLIKLTTASLGLQRQNQVCEVQITPEAKAFFDQVELLTTQLINNTKRDSLRDLWNRAHLKTMKLAALVAVGIDHLFPLVDLACAQWAYNIVSNDIIALTTRFRRGEIGRSTNESEQGEKILDKCEWYVSQPWEDVRSYGGSEVLHKNFIIPHSMMSRALMRNKLFMNDKRGATRAIKETIAALIASGDIAEVGKGTLINTYKFSGQGYVLLTTNSGTRGDGEV